MVTIASRLGATKRVLTIAGVGVVLGAQVLFAQVRQSDPLNDQQTEELREYADRPVEKLRLFVKYIEERAAEIHRLNADPAAQNWSAELHNLYQEFTRISDELEDNMDSYHEQHADLRKELKEVIEKSGKWPAVLNEPKSNADYDFVRKTALAASQSVHDAAKEMLDDEVKYFAQHKAQKNSGG